MLRPAFLTAVASLSLVLGQASTACAQAIDPLGKPPAEADTEDTKKPVDGPRSDKGKKPDLKEELKSLTDDLLDLVVGPKRDKKGGKPAAQADKAEKDPLESAIEGMRNARQRMADKDTGSGTRDIQEQVVKDLEKLIQQAKNPPKSSSPPPPQNSQDQNPQTSRNQNRQKSPQPNTPEDQKQEQAAESGETQGQQKTESEKARESSDEARAAREREAELARRRDLVKDVWGHLPPALRQKLLNGSGDKSLPRYDDLIRRYFESLAEEGSTSPRRKP